MQSIILHAINDHYSCAFIRVLRQYTLLLQFCNVVRSIISTQSVIPPIMFLVIPGVLIIQIKHYSRAFIRVLRQCTLLLQFFNIVRSIISMKSVIPPIMFLVIPGVLTIQINIIHVLLLGSYSNIPYFCNFAMLFDQS